MCGRRSDPVNKACGMKLCCGASGWCGTDAEHCLKAPGWGPNPDDGKCQDVPGGYCGDPAAKAPAQCGAGSSRGRKIAYWQSNNVERRQCGYVDPGSINYKGFDYLYYAFGAINPNTHRIVDDPRKQETYRNFTALQHKPDGPKTWIAIGGFDFSNVGGDPCGENDGSPMDTHNAW